MSAITFRAGHWTSLRERLLREPVETCAALLCSHGVDGRVIVRDGDAVPDEAYSGRTEIAAELEPRFLVEVANRARAAGCGLLLAHTHPQVDGIPTFSEEDDTGERAMGPYLTQRLRGQPLMALLIGGDGARARHLGSNTQIPVWSVGADLVRVAGTTSGAASPVEERYDRQVRAFGAAGQLAVASLKVCVVGVGGTGSVLVQQLARLGVSDFVLIDPDRLETTNLNRVVGSKPSDIGRPKVEVARDAIIATNPLANVHAVVGDVLDIPNALLVAGADFAVACTDSHASRALICQVAYQHHVPSIDVGVAIGVASGKVTHVTGRVQMLSPGLPCLLCTEALDGDRIRMDLMSSDQRAADPYFDGEGEPQPAVISLNSTMSSLATTMFLSAVAGVPAAARHQSYDARSGTVRPVAATARDGCPICSPRGALSKGVAWSLPTRPSK